MKTEREQQLAINLFAQKLTLLDERFRKELAQLNNAGVTLRSVNDLITITTETLIDEYVFTEMTFHTGLKLPYDLKMALIEEFSAIFRK